MSKSTGIVIGLLIGLIVGMVGVGVTAHHMNGRAQKLQAAAFDDGVQRGLSMATEGGLDISGQLNQGMAADNERMITLLEATHERLAALAARDDLPDGAAEELAAIMAEIGE